MTAKKFIAPAGKIEDDVTCGRTEKTAVGYLWFRSGQ